MMEGGPVIGIVYNSRQDAIVAYPEPALADHRWRAARR